MTAPLFDDGPTPRINATIDTWLTQAPVMAEHCQVPGYPIRKRCFVCHREDALKVVAPGWGGVWACRDCEPS